MRGVLGLVVLLAAHPQIDAQQLLAGRVIAVHDGDTVSIRTSKTTWQSKRVGSINTTASSDA